MNKFSISERLEALSEEFKKPMLRFLGIIIDLVNVNESTRMQYIAFIMSLCFNPSTDIVKKFLKTLISLDHTTKSIKYERKTSSSEYNKNVVFYDNNLILLNSALFSELSKISGTSPDMMKKELAERRMLRINSRENFHIALPAALASLALILVLTLRADVTPAEIPPYNLIQIIPYVLVLIGGIIGINVFVVLLIGIVSGSVIALATGVTGQSGILAVKALLENMGSGAAGMFETSMVAILVSAICALIREFGGFEALLGWIRRAFRGKRGGQIGMGLLVGAMDIATANNTVAIVMANPIAKEMSEEYGITPRKAASLLDTFSCIFQGIIPYGAQMLVAISAAHELGYNISAFDIIPNLFYPYLLAVSSLFFIAVDGKKKGS